MTHAEIRVTSLFGGSENQISGHPIEGGRVFALFGSSDIDLRHASPAESGATIRVIAGFGSVRLLVPEDWAVNVQTRAILGGVASRRVAPDSPKGQLTLTGFCLLGSLEIRS